jgi:hypothetical protein
MESHCLDALVSFVVVGIHFVNPNYSSKERRLSLTAAPAFSTLNSKVKTHLVFVFS